ncbi:MAG: amidophosphoribosyltransferase [Gammaproteobacteria bacterium]
MCGIVGIVAQHSVNQDLYDALTVLQHRGQDAAGIATCEDGQIFLRKGNGLVRDVFNTENMLFLRGNMGMGHTRYPTAGSSCVTEAQPFYVNSPYGLTLAHNGTLTNADTLREDLFRTDLRHINTGSDSEILLNVFAHELQTIAKQPLTPELLFQAVTRVHERCTGAYAALVMITGYGVLGFTDPHGIRPLVYGYRETPEGREYMLASESVALDVLGFTRLGDALPGEAVFIDTHGRLHQQRCTVDEFMPCIFEYVYLARPDSIIANVSVYKARLNMGLKLGEKILREWPDHDIDVVMPIPDTSRTSALPLAQCLGVELREGFVKNRYIGRTFIMPGQTQRKKSVRQKLNAITDEFAGKNVLLLDDSIVRGTTSQQIVQMARQAGAKKVYFASASPEIRFPNVYGIDMPAAEELVAHQRSLAEIQEFLGADRLFYQDLDSLIASVRELNPQLQNFECSIFTGDYITGDVDQAYLERLARKRNDAARK